LFRSQSDAIRITKFTSLLILIIDKILGTLSASLSIGSQAVRVYTLAIDKIQAGGDTGGALAGLDVMVFAEG